MTTIILAIVLLFCSVSTIRISAAPIVISNAEAANIDDNLGEPVVRPFDVPYRGIVHDVDVVVDFAKADGEEFLPPYNGRGSPFLNEIWLRVIHPTGIAVDLIALGSLGAGSAPGFSGVIRFDDSAALRVNNDPEHLVAGTFRPTGPGSLTDFTRISGEGVWRLEMIDSGLGDSFRFRGASLMLEVDTDTPIPEPGTFGLLSLATGLLLFRRKRIRS
jgi:hypothetical protein